MLDVTLLIEVGIFKLVLFYIDMDHAVEEEMVLVPMIGWVVLILNDAVVAESQSVQRFGIDQRLVEGFEDIVLDDHALALPAVEILLLVFQVGDFREDGNHAIGKLEHIGQRVDETVLSDHDIATGSGLKPAVAVAAK